MESIGVKKMYTDENLTTPHFPTTKSINNLPQLQGHTVTAGKSSARKLSSKETLEDSLNEKFLASPPDVNPKSPLKEAHSFKMQISNSLISKEATEKLLTTQDTINNSPENETHGNKIQIPTFLMSEKPQESQELQEFKEIKESKESFAVVDITTPSLIQHPMYNPQNLDVMRQKLLDLALASMTTTRCQTNFHPHPDAKYKRIVAYANEQKRQKYKNELAREQRQEEHEQKMKRIYLAHKAEGTIYFSKPPPQPMQ